MQRKERLRAHCRRFFFAIETNNSQHTDGNSQLFIYGHALTFLDDYFHDRQSLKRVTGTFILIFSSFIPFINFQRWILTSKRLRRFINIASLLGPVEVFVRKSWLLICTLNCFSQIYWSEWVIAFKFSLFDKGQDEHMIWKVVSKPARAGPAWYRTHRAGIFAWISWFCLSYHSHVPIRFIIDIVCFECTWPKHRRSLGPLLAQNVIKTRQTSYLFCCGSQTGEHGQLQGRLLTPVKKKRHDLIVEL